MYDNTCELDDLLIEYDYLICNLAKYNKVPSLDEDDVAQELRMLLIKCVQKFNPDKGTQFKTYFTRSSINKINELRRRHNKNLSLNNTTKSGDEFIDFLDGGSEAGTVLIKQEIIDYLHTLPYGEATVRHLAYGETQVSLASELGITKGWLNKKIKDNIQAVKDKFRR